MRLCQDLREKLLELHEDGSWSVRKDTSKPRRGVALDLVVDLAPYIEAWNSGVRNRVGTAQRSGLKTKNRDAKWEQAIRTFKDPEEWRACAIALSTSRTGMDWCPSQGHLRWLLTNPMKLENFMVAGQRLRTGEYQPECFPKEQRGLPGLVDQATAALYGGES